MTKKIKEEKEKRNSSETKRRFTPYELNLILKAEFDPQVVEQEIGVDKPVEYYLGLAEFRQKLFSVNKHTLIPRVETEEMVDFALLMVDTDLKDKKLITFCDIGTGSGCIGVSFALELQKREMPYIAGLTDLSSYALEIALENAGKHLDLDQTKVVKVNSAEMPKTKSPDKSIVHVFQADLRSKEPLWNADILFANLPYIPSDRIEILDNSVKDFEPVSALDGGKDGLDLIKIFLKKISESLQEGSFAILEVDDTHTVFPKEFSSEFKIMIRNDVYGRNRFWIIQKL